MSPSAVAKSTGWMLPKLNVRLGFGGRLCSSPAAVIGPVLRFISAAPNFHHYPAGILMIRTRTRAALLWPGHSPAPSIVRAGQWTWRWGDVVAGFRYPIQLGIHLHISAVQEFPESSTLLDWAEVIVAMALGDALLRLLVNTYSNFHFRHRGDSTSARWRWGLGVIWQPKNRNFEFWCSESNNIDNLRWTFYKTIKFTSFGVFKCTSRKFPNPSDVCRSLTQTVEWRPCNACSQKFMNGFYGYVGGKRQIDVEHGSEYFASISTADFELSWKFARGQNPPPSSSPAGCVLTIYTWTPLLVLSYDYTSRINALFGNNENSILVGITNSRLFCDSRPYWEFPAHCTVGFVRSLLPYVWNK